MAHISLRQPTRYVAQQIRRSRKPIRILHDRSELSRQRLSRARYSCKATHADRSRHHSFAMSDLNYARYTVSDARRA